jgi:hypothetical protein
MISFTEEELTDLKNLEEVSYRKMERQIIGESSHGIENIIDENEQEELENEYLFMDMWTREEFEEQTIKNSSFYVDLKYFSSKGLTQAQRTEATKLLWEYVYGKISKEEYNELVPKPIYIQLFVHKCNISNDLIIF